MADRGSIEAGDLVLQPARGAADTQGTAMLTCRVEQCRNPGDARNAIACLFQSCE
jgi:hypothetical protein